MEAKHTLDLSLEGVEYPAGFYHEQAPVHLDYVCALNGIRGPSVANAFTYCELGCGAGETSCILAAANPAGDFIGIDLSPAHIARATELAQAGQLNNVRFIEADILQLDARALPDFDFITLHGLYSWVSAEVKAAIRDFIDGKLKPGGVVYITYNAMPGWGSASALRRFFIDTAARLDGAPTERAAKVLEILENLRAKEAPFFSENPTAGGVLKRLLKEDIRYVAHEFLASSWQALYFDEVNRQMEAIGLDFVGSGEILENFVEHSVRPEFHDVLHDCPDGVSRECMRDFIQNRFFRRDVFVRSAEQRDAADPLADTLLGMVAAPAQIPDSVKVVGGKLDMSGAWFERIKDLLAYRVRSFSEILADPSFKEVPREDLVRGLKLLTIGRFIAPFARRETEPPAGAANRIRMVPPLNEALLQRHDWSETSRVFASPVSGAGVVLNALETALLGALEVEDHLSWLWAEVGRRGMSLKPVKGNGGGPIEDEHEAKEALSDSLERFKAHKLPKLAYLGIVEPA